MGCEPNCADVGEDKGDEAEIRSLACPACMLCGDVGEELYSGLRDRLFGARGAWGLRRCRSTSCGLVWLDPMPIKEDLWKAYTNYYTHAGKPTGGQSGMLRRAYDAAKRGYLARRFGYYTGQVSLADRLLGLAFYLHPGRRANLDFEAFYLPSRPGGRLLEIGCGSGAMLLGMRERGWNVEGVDFDPNAVATARARGLAVHCGSLQDQQLPASAFDAIVMSHAIEHIPDPRNLLAECKRLLKPGGLLVSITPNSESLGRALFRSDHLHLDPPRHLYLYNRNTTSRLLSEAGLQVMDVRTTIRWADGLMAANRSLRLNGRYSMGQPESAGVRLWAGIMQLIECGLRLVCPNIGEEIVVVARR